jgi:hypothetical protein
MTTPIALVVAGLACIALFLWLNLSVQPRWFPDEIDRGDGAPTSRSGAAPVSHCTLGLFLGALLLAGVVMLALGWVELGIMYSRK